MSKLEIIALSGVVYKVKSTGPSTEPCGTPYESVTLSEKVYLLTAAHSATRVNRNLQQAPTS